MENEIIDALYKNQTPVIDMVKKKKLKLKVIFDTNVVYTGSASDLLRKEIVELINSHKSLSDIEIEWYIPETVIKERIFQMNKKGNELLPGIQKLEKLLGHNLNITKDIIEGKVLDVVNKQLTVLGIETIKLDVAAIDWSSIINNSLNRLIPFEDNEKKKGFRDALILECLKQVIAVSPKTKSICRIAFITNDTILNRAAGEIAGTASNVNIFSNASEFVSLINIIDSKITEDLINTIINDSEKLFFIKEDSNTLYYTQAINKQITEKFPKEFMRIQGDGLNRETGTWWIGKPGFERKNRQQVLWKTMISVDFTDYRITYSETSARDDYYSIDRSNSNLGMLMPSGSAVSGGNRSNDTYSMMGMGIGIPKGERLSTVKEKFSEGKIKFEVTWSVTLTAGNKLKNPKVETLRYVDTIVQI